MINLFRLFPPNTPGKMRAARFLLRRRLQEKNTWVRDKFGHELKVPCLQEPIGLELLINGAYEHQFLDFLLKRLAPGDSFIDVGANIGCFTLPCASRVGPNGRVLAVEASATITNYLRENIAANRLGNITVARAAVSDEEGRKMTFYESPVERFGMGSFGPQFSPNRETLITRSLDGLLKEHGISSARAMKIDIEGAEALAFEGARELLSGPAAPLIVFEFVDWAEKRMGLEPGAAQKKLMSFGYKIRHLENYPGKILESPLTEGASNLIAEK